MIVLILMLTLAELDATTAYGQGGIRIRQPVNGTIRINSHVDHGNPNGVRVGTMEPYTGGSYNDCPAAGLPWTTQGPFCYPGHRGVDYVVVEGTPVFAAASGVVSFVQPDKDADEYGVRVNIDHGNGYVTLYAHLQEGGILVLQCHIRGWVRYANGIYGNGYDYRDV